MRGVVILRSTGPQNNPTHFTAEFCDALREADPVAFQTDVQAEFANPESGWLSPIAVRQATREQPLELPPTKGAKYAAAADVGTDRLSLVIVEGYEAEEDEDGESRPFYRVAQAFESRGGTPDSRWAEIAARCRRYGLSVCVADQYAAAESASIAKREGLKLDVVPWAQANRLEAFTNLATIVHAARIEFPPDRVFRSDLLAIRRRTTQTGVTVVLPTTRDGRHCDFAPALAAALRAAQRACKLRDLSVGAPGRANTRGWALRGGASGEKILPLNKDEKGREFHYLEPDDGDEE
jgi:hypothetical protein